MGYSVAAESAQIVVRPSYIRDLHYSTRSAC